MLMLIFCCSCFASVLVIVIDAGTDAVDLLLMLLLVLCCTYFCAVDAVVDDDAAVDLM